MADKKKSGDLYRSVVVPAPPVEEPAPSAAVVPSAPAPKPVAAPAPTPTAALPTAPTVKTPVAARPKVRKPAALKPAPSVAAVVKPVATKPTRTQTSGMAQKYGEMLEAQQAQREEELADLELFDYQRKLDKELSAKREQEARQAARSLPSITEDIPYGATKSEVTSGQYFNESQSLLKEWYSEQAAIAREEAKRGNKLDTETIRRRAAAKVAFKSFSPTPDYESQDLATVSSRPMGITPIALSSLGYLKDLGVSALAGAMSTGTTASVPAGALVFGGTIEGINAALEDMERREAYIKRVQTRLGDPITTRMLQDVERQMKQYKDKKTETIAPKIVSAFRNKYADEVMVQGGFDQLKNTDMKAYLAKRAEAEREANEVIDALRVVGNPVFKAGIGLVTTDTVKKAFDKGVLDGLKEVGRIFLPQETVTSGGEAVRVESIPATIIRDIISPVVAGSGILPMPGERGGLNLGYTKSDVPLKEGEVYRGDPFARVQTGRGPIVDVMENDWVRRTLSEGDAEEKAAAYALITAAFATEIGTPGLEIPAGAAIGYTVAKLGDVAKVALDVSDAIKTARTGSIKIWDDALGATRVVTMDEIPGTLERLAQTARLARETYKNTKNTEKVVEGVANSARISSTPYLPSYVNVALERANPAIARIYRDNFLKYLSENKAANEALDILKEDMRVNNIPGVDNEFSIIASRDADSVIADLERIKANAQASIDPAKDLAERARRELVEVNAAVQDESTIKRAKELKQIISENNATLKKSESTVRRIDVLLADGADGIAKNVHDASRNALSKMIGRDLAAASTPVRPVTPEEAPTQVNIPVSPGRPSVREVSRAFGGISGRIKAPNGRIIILDRGISTEEARKLVSIADIKELITGRNAKTATAAQTALAQDVVARLEESTGVKKIIDRLMIEGVTDPFDILRALERSTPDAASKNVSALDDAYDKLWRRHIEAEVQLNKIVEQNLATDLAKQQFKVFTDELDEAVEMAKRASADLVQARKIKVPSQAVRRIKQEKAAERTALLKKTAEDASTARNARIDAINTRMIELAREESAAGRSLDFDSLAAIGAERQALEAEVTALKEARKLAGEKPRFTPLLNQTELTQDVVKTATAENAGEIIATVEHAEDVGPKTQSVVSQARTVRQALREKIVDPILNRIVEMRYGADRTQPYAVSGEWFERPDQLMTPRRPVKESVIPNKEYSLGRHQNRTFMNNVKYVMEEGEAYRTRLRELLAEMEKANDPRAPELKKYIERGSLINDEAHAQFAERMGIPRIKNWTTQGEMFNKGGLDKVYARFDEIADSMPEVPRARSENSYYRWLSVRSAPDEIAHTALRMDDYVEVRNVELAQRAGPIKQKVVMPDGTSRFASEGFVGDRFTGNVVGAVERDGVKYAVINVHEYSPTSRISVPTKRVIEVPMDQLILLERGRVKTVRFGVKGGKNPEYRPMSETEWAELGAREDKIFGDLKGKLQYSNDINPHVYNDLAPPKRPTIEDFDFFTDADLKDMSRANRQIAKPRMEVIEGGGVAAAEEAPTMTGRPAAAVAEAAPVAIETEQKLSEEARRAYTLKSRMVEAAMEQRSNALERLQQAQQAVSDYRGATKKGMQDIVIDTLHRRIKDLGEEMQKIASASSKEREIADAAEEYARVSGDVFGEVMAGRKQMTARLEEAQRKAILAVEQERVGAKEVGDLGRVERTLDDQVREEMRRIASTSGGFSELVRGVGRLAGGAREVVESTLPQSMRELNKNIRLNYSEANQIILDAVTEQRAKSPADKLVNAMDSLDNTKYGATWSDATASGRLNPSAVDGVAFSYVAELEKLIESSKEAAEALRSIVRNGAGSTSELSDALFNYVRESGIPIRDRAVGDVQLLQSIASQTVVDAAITEAFGAGALFTREEAAQVHAWLHGQTGRNAARGRELALSIMSSAVDTSSPLTKLGVAELKNSVVGRSVLKSLDATGADVAANASVGTAKVAALDAFSQAYAGELFLPEPVALQLNATIKEMVAATRTRADNGLSSLYHRDVVYGLLVPRTKFYYNNVLQDADQVAVGIGLGTAVRSGVAGSLNMLLSAPFVSLGTGLSDIIRGARAGTTAENVINTIGKVNNFLAGAAFGTGAQKVMTRSADVIKDIGLTGEDLWRIGTREGVGETMQSSEIIRELDLTFKNRGSRWFGTLFTEQTKEIGELITARKRWGAYVAILENEIAKGGGAVKMGEAGVRAAAQRAAKLTTASFMDYAANLHPVERNAVWKVLQPFWAYDKSNMIRMWKLLTTDGTKLKGAYAAAAAGYRFGRWTRGKKALADLASFYFEQNDMYGFDVESMKKDDEARPEGEKLYPLYEQAMKNAEASGLEAVDVRLSGPYSEDPRLDVFSTFTDYFQPKPPLYFEPDQYSRFRAPFAIVIADAKMQSWAMFNDYSDPNNKIGDQDKYTYILPPDDGNLYAFMRPIAMMNIMGVMAQAASGKIDPDRASKLTENVVDIVGDPISFSPIAQAISEVVMLSYDKENVTNILPIRLDDRTGKVMHDLGLAVLENKPVKVEMTNSEFGPIKTTMEPGYYISKHIAVGLRGTMPTVSSALGGATLAGNVIDIMSKLVEEQDERVRADLILQLRKYTSFVPATSVSVQRAESRQSKEIIGDIVRYGEGIATRTEVPLTAEGIRRAALQAGESKGNLDDQTTRVYRDAIIEKSAMTIPEEDLRAVAVADGLITPEQSDTTSRAQLLSMVRDSPKAHKILREGGQFALDGMPTLERQQMMIKRANEAMIYNNADPFQVSIARAALANQGVDVDAMSHDDVRKTLMRKR